MASAEAKGWGYPTGAVLPETWSQWSLIQGPTGRGNENKFLTHWLKVSRIQRTKDLTDTQRWTFSGTEQGKEGEESRLGRAIDNLQVLLTMAVLHILFLCPDSPLHANPLQLLNSFSFSSLSSSICFLGKWSLTNSSQAPSFTLSWNLATFLLSTYLSL